MSLALGKPKTTVFTVCVCLQQQKSRYLQYFLPRTEQKHWYLRSFQHVARGRCELGATQKHCILRCFCFYGTEKSSTCQYVWMLPKAWTWGDSNGRARGGPPPPLKANLLVTQANSCTCTAPGPILATQGGTQVAYRYLSRHTDRQTDRQKYIHTYITYTHSHINTYISYTHTNILAYK